MPLHIQKLRSKATIFTILAVLSMCIIVAFLVAVQRNAHAAAPLVVPLSPENNSYATGSVTLTSKVNDLEPNEYEMFWATNGGEWNRMTTNPSTKLSSATIDISQWDWRNDQQYTIRFIALIKADWRPIEQSVTINKGVAPTTTTTVRPSLPAVSVPVVTDSLYTDPQSVPAQKLIANPSNTTLQYIAAQPLAKWFGDWNTSVTSEVDEYVTRAGAVGAIPTIVLYNIPKRDCGSYSSGGAQTYTLYQTWGKQVAEGIKNRKAIVIVEPDSLSAMDCLTSSERSNRMNAIADIVGQIKTASSKVYIDAGHSTWHSTATMASRLRSAGVAKADGFSLNISNFRTTQESTTYGDTISSKLGGKHFVIDTSRNGAGPSSDKQWCNPAGRALGARPTLSTGKALVDAYLWIKTPGESDGACGRGAPAAGQWWQTYADMLYENK